MDENGLPIVGAGIDYHKVKPIDKKRLLAFVNHYVIHTVRFVNKFAGVCEEKMMRMERQLQKLEITMNIIETKLSSIPDLDHIKAPESAATTNSSAPAPVQPITSQQNPGTTPLPPPSVPDVPAPPPPEEPSYVKVSQDPTYSKYFRMLNVGVPAPAVKMKMAAEGLNPDLLDTPDAAAPSGGTAAGNDGSSSEAEFTDSD